MGWKVANELIGSSWKFKQPNKLPPQSNKRQRESGGVRFAATNETAVFKPTDSASTINTVLGAFLISSTVVNPYKNIGDKFEVCARQE